MYELRIYESANTRISCIVPNYLFSLCDDRIRENPIYPCYPCSMLENKKLINTNKKMNFYKDEFKSFSSRGFAIKFSNQI